MLVQSLQKKQAVVSFLFALVVWLFVSAMDSFLSPDQQKAVGVLLALMLVSTQLFLGIWGVRSDDAWIVTALSIRWHSADVQDKIQKLVIAGGFFAPYYVIGRILDIISQDTILWANLILACVIVSAPALIWPRVFGTYSFLISRFSEGMFSESDQHLLDCLLSEKNKKSMDILGNFYLVSLALSVFPLAMMLFVAVCLHRELIIAFSIGAYAFMGLMFLVGTIFFGDHFVQTSLVLYLTILSNTKGEKDKGSTGSIQQIKVLLAQRIKLVKKALIILAFTYIVCSFVLYAYL